MRIFLTNKRNILKESHLRQSEEGEVEELDVSIGGGEDCRQGAQLNFWHRGAVTWGLGGGTVGQYRA